MELFWEKYFEGVMKYEEGFKQNIRKVIFYISNNADIMADFVNAVILFMDKKSDFNRTKETVQENFRNWTAYHKTVLPNREYIILLYYIYSLHTNELNMTEQCNKILNFRNFTPLSKRSLFDYLFEIGITYKVDYRVIFSIMKKYSDIEWNKSQKKLVRSYTTGSYINDLENSTTISLKKSLEKDIEEKNIEDSITDIIEKYKYSFSESSKIRRYTALKLIQRIMKKCRLTNIDQVENILNDTFSASFGDGNVIQRKQEPTKSKLVARINSGKRNITRQGIVMLAIAAQIYDIYDINNLLVRCDFEILDSSFSGFDCLICDVLKHDIRDWREFELLFSKYYDDFLKCSLYQKAEDKKAFHIAYFPISYNCMTTKGI